MKFENIELEMAKQNFREASLKMQNFVVGYMKIGNSFEPAISSEESFMPLNSFGVSNSYIVNKFIPFPDGKNLTQMLREPIEFNNWCKENLK